VPLIVIGPGLKKGLVTKDLVSQVDIYPTLMDMAGLEHPDWLVGHSLMPLMKGQPAERPDWVLSQYHSNMTNTGIFMLRQGPWKYIAYAGYEPQLFNLQDDPEEMNNLAQQRKDLTRDMDAKLRRIVDYPAVDAKVKAYDKASFRKWRAGLDDKAFREAMARVYKLAPWTSEDDNRLAAWLNAP
jgi:choline-sulfatase